MGKRKKYCGLERDKSISIFQIKNYVFLNSWGSKEIRVINVLNQKISKKLTSKVSHICFIDLEVGENDVLNLVCKGHSSDDKKIKIRKINLSKKKVEIFQFIKITDNKLHFSDFNELYKSSSESEKNDQTSNEYSFENNKHKVKNYCENCQSQNNQNATINPSQMNIIYKVLEILENFHQNYLIQKNEEQKSEYKNKKMEQLHVSLIRKCKF